MTSPIPADHISNTNPISGMADGGQAGKKGDGQAAAEGGQAAPAGGEAELLELQARLAYHGRRLFRHEVR